MFKEHNNLEQLVKTSGSKKYAITLELSEQELEALKELLGAELEARSPYISEESPLYDVLESLDMKLRGSPNSTSSLI